MRPLFPCPECDRHVRTSDPTCPFCGTELPAARAAQRTATPVLAGLGRAAIVAFGAAAIGVTGCGDDGGPSTDGGGAADAPLTIDGGGNDGGGDDDAGGGDDDAGATTDGGVDGGGVAPPYGTPPEDGGTPVPAYGAPPP